MGMGLEMPFGDGIKDAIQEYLLNYNAVGQKMSIKMVSVSGMHLNCIWRPSLYEQKNGVRVWGISEL